MLTAVGVDPNDCIFPIAIAIVEVEDTVTWKWFLNTLKEDLNIENTAPWTLMSDRQKVSFHTVAFHISHCIISYCSISYVFYTLCM